MPSDASDLALDLAERQAFARELGFRLQRLRHQRGLSQEKLAHLAGISTYTYQKFEKGESRPGTPMNPRLFTLMALARALRVNVEEIVGPEGQHTPYRS